jgi:hypothetical protein
MTKVKAILLALAVLFGTNVAFAADGDNGSRVKRDYSQVDNYNP